MKNQYKRQDIFKCSHDAHRQRGHHVSVYHTLHRKKCFPNGCTYFRWKCIELEHRRKCYRGYSHVGRTCQGCRFFDEEKMTRLLVKEDPRGYPDFVELLQDFEEWLRDHVEKRHECLGTIRSVKPHIKMFGEPSGNPSVHLAGYLVCFENTFIGNERIDDPVFAVVGRAAQQRLQLRRGDELEFEAILTVDEGRLRLDQWRKIDFRVRAENEMVWNDSKSVVARSTGTMLKHQAEKCIACDQGMLVDVVRREYGKDRLLHRIFCLQGMASASACTYDAGSELYTNSCSNRAL